MCAFSLSGKLVADCLKRARGNEGLSRVISRVVIVTVQVVLMVEANADDRMYNLCYVFCTSVNQCQDYLRSLSVLFLVFQKSILYSSDKILLESVFSCKYLMNQNPEFAEQDKKSDRRINLTLNFSH